MNNQKSLPLVVIFQDSINDTSHSEIVSNTLNILNINNIIRICSAIESPKRLIQLINRYESSGKPIVYIACGDNSLSNMIDSNSTSPVILCPSNVNNINNKNVNMLVTNPKKSAINAAKILALYDPEILIKIKNLQNNNATLLHVEDSKYKVESYVNRITNAVESNDMFIKTDLKLKPRGEAKEVKKYVGKVRDRYNDGKNVFLVTTDRLTGFDRFLANIPYKGQVLNLTSKWWFEQTEHIIKNHVVKLKDENFEHPNITVGRECKPFPIEFVVRGYITGSSSTAMWTNYNKGVRDYCGIKLPEGLKKNQKLWENLITPTTKSDEHDELISPEDIVKKGYMTQEDWDFCSKKALEIFNFGQKIAAERGLILVDTKYEMGKDLETGEILLIDEIHTPDSSRYWLSHSYEQNMKEGKSPANIDKEFVRKWFASKCDPYKDEVLPTAPIELRVELSKRYIMLYELITGNDFPFQDNKLSVNEACQAVIDLQNA